MTPAIKTLPTTPKVLGITAVNAGGRAAWRVVWRLWREDRLPTQGFKSDQGSTALFYIDEDCPPEVAFAKATELVAQVYRRPELRKHSMPEVDWAAGGAVVDGRQTRRRGTEDFDRARSMFDSGMSPTQVGKVLQVSRSTASRWRSEMRRPIS